MGSDWLLRAAMALREKQIAKARGRDLVSDACDSGGALRHREAEERRRRLEAMQGKLFEREEGER